MQPTRDSESDAGPTTPDRLESWKEIADYLGKGVTTVRRWEHEEGLPVRRVGRLKRGSVMAYREDLDSWVRNRTSPSPDAPAAEEPRGRRWGNWWLAGAAAVALLAIAGARGVRPGYDEVEFRILTADPGGESQPAFAPGGERFAYSTGSGIMVKEVRGGPARRIFSEPSQNTCCVRWSPDGKWLAISFTRTTHHWEIALLEPSGKFNRHLGTGGPHLAWARDSKAVIYTKAESRGGPAALFEHGLESGRARQISFPPPGAWGDIAGRPSPDGRQLALTRFLSFGKGDVYVSDYGGKAARRVTRLENWVVGVDWLPDGENVVFGGDVGRRAGLFRVPANGSGAPELIEDTEGTNRYPEVAALHDGGVRIAFVHENWNQDLMRFDPATGRAGPVAVSTVADEVPDVSAEGRLVFESARSGYVNLWVCDAAHCSEPRQITHFRDPYLAMFPRWSPDGRSIAFTTRPAGRQAIQIMGADGESRRTVSEGDGEEALSFSADGRALYIRSRRSGNPEIWRIPVDGGGQPVRITSGGGGEAFESADGRWLYLTRGLENAALLRRPLAGGGNEKVVEAVSGLRAGQWRVNGQAILWWKEGGTLHRLDPETGVSSQVLTAGQSRRVISFTANIAGVVVWASQGSLEDDILAVDLRPKSFWRMLPVR